MKIYTNISKYAKSKRIPISRIERELGFSDGQLAKWNKNMPSIDKVTSVADYLGISLDEICERKSTSKNTPYLSSEELQLLNMYKSLSVDGKYMIFHMAEILVENSKKDNQYSGVEGTA